MYTWIIVLVLVVAKLALQLPLLARYGFHRDEFLYLSLGDHLAWGYWSNPPLIGWISALVQATLGDSIFAMRLVPILLSAGLIALVVLMARQMGGSWVAQLVAGTAALVVPPHLRAGAMFQPVIFDVFAWTLLTYLLVRWCHYEDKRWILWFGLVFGLGLLNKL
ncbi:MAG: glycosyltransferase family 39 protein, partial [Lewinella sp.]|nr:glycosyltransferase family 39 protein [Lewinella sp.]